jgi:hypothetical protein
MDRKPLDELRFAHNFLSATLIVVTNIRFDEPVIYNVHRTKIGPISIGISPFHYLLHQRNKSLFFGVINKTSPFPKETRV